MPSSECSQGVGDDGQINPFLKHRARGRRGTPNDATTIAARLKSIPATTL